MSRRIVVFAVGVAMIAAGSLHGEPTKKIVLLAGPKSHGPVGNGVHDYGWSARLIRMMLETSSVKENVRVEVYLDGWPRDPKTLETADTIMVISDGRDGDLFAEAPHLASPERVRFMQKQIQRGCGFMTFHFSTFAPQQYASQMLDWSGGYFQWETDGKRQWYSAIATAENNVRVGSPAHPVARGLEPFKMREEFYYNIRFTAKDARLQPIWVVPELPGREPDGRVVAWARERPDGGRGFGTTCGHFYDNWKQAQFRKMILNAIAWTAKLEVPAGGIDSRYFTHEEIEQHEQPPIRVLMFSGNDQHQWHNWEKTTPAIRLALEKDPRIRVEISHDIEDLARKKLSDYQVIIQNYVNWHDPKGLSPMSKKAFVDFVASGGGLVVIHFANGAYHFSLPEAGGSDWPEYRKIVRRVWNHQGTPPSGHDPFATFVAEPTKAKHVITEGLKPFAVTDELYFRQAGTEPIEPLLSARSRMTKNDEPLAWVTNYEKGRVFQTLLGHSEKTYDAFEACEMLRRAVAWCARRDVRMHNPSFPPPLTPSKPLAPGKFGHALDTRTGGLFVAGAAEYREPPLTAECWAQMRGLGQYHILIANELKTSATHWEIFTEPGTGHFTAFLPGYKPDHVHSTTNVVDGQWHHLALLWEPGRVRLAVDGTIVATQNVTFQNGKSIHGRLAVGALVGKELGSSGLIDEVRISRGIRNVKPLPTKPYQVDETTLGLWHLDQMDQNRTPDESARKNHGVLEPISHENAPAGPSSKDQLDYAPVDPLWKAVLLDRSDDDAFIAVKMDSQGQIFVGGRESLFVYEPQPDGGYGRKRELKRFPPNSILMGLEVRGNDLYVLTANALYLLPEARIKRQGVKAERLLWGIPLDLHVSFHCLAWGPEGDLYLNHGDPLLQHGDFSRPDHWGHWTLYHRPENANGKPWTSTTYTGNGAVLRIKPDGTRVRVVATGLRGPVGLCFDRNWNLFTNDNDHEGIPDRYGYTRLLHVVPGIDFAWPRGWMASKSPERRDLVEPMISNSGRGVPVGLAYMDEPGFPAWQNSLIQARWDRGQLVSCPLRERGSTFETEELPFTTGQLTVRPTGVTVGTDGRVLTTIHYLPGNTGTPHCISDLVLLTRKDIRPMEPIDLTAVSAARLWEELSQPSWVRRSQAHTELLRRGTPVLQEAIHRMKRIQENDPARVHLPWLIAAGGGNDTGDYLRALTKHPRTEVRLQAIRALIEFPALADSTSVFVESLRDANAPVRLAAMAAFFTTGRPFPLNELASATGSDDSYVRQTAAKILAERATSAQLTELSQSENPNHRLAAVLACGIRLTVPRTDFVPPQNLPLTYAQGNAFFKLSYDGEPHEIDLKSLTRCGAFVTSDLWSAGAKSVEQQSDFDVLLRSLDDRHDRVVQQSAYYLSLLRDPRSEVAIAKVRMLERERKLTKLASLELSRVWLVGPFSDGPQGIRTPHPPETGAVDLSAQYPTGNGAIAWRVMMPKQGQFDVPVRQGGSSYLFFQIQSSVRQTGVVALSVAGVRIWHNGKLLSDALADKVFWLDLQPGSNDILIRVADPVAIQIRSETRASAFLPDRLDGSELARRLRDGANPASVDTVPKEFLAFDWVKEIEHGDLSNGRKLFGTLGCSKCHAIVAGQAGNGAPSLVDARKRFTAAYVIESVLLPNKQVAEPFRATRIDTKKGRSIVGLVVADGPNGVEILLPDASRTLIAVTDIESRTVMNRSPMPPGLVKTPAELRDLVAYVLSERPLPP